MDRLDLYQRLFDAALERRPEERAAYVAQASGNDEELRSTVEALLQHHDDAPSDFPAPLATNDGVSRGAAPTDGPHTNGASLPDQIGRFRIIRKIADGGMGTVYEAEQESPRRAVALKVLRGDLLTTDAARARFEREVQVLGLLHHPGIAQIHDAGTADPGQGPVPYFAMELVRGTPLTEYARGLDTRARLELLDKVCDAIEYAHQNGVIHRDLKPSNILVDEAGRPRVLDFGIARLTSQGLQSPPPETGYGQILGTVAYMSPEQASMNASVSIDQRSDIYTLGILAYELLAERHPVVTDGMSIVEVLRAIQVDEPRPLSDRSSALRGDIETIVRKAMAKEPSQRYQSVRAFAADVRRYLHDEPILARPASAAYRVRKFTGRHRLVVGMAAVALLALVGGMAGATYGMLRARTAAHEAQQGLAILIDLLRASGTAPLAANPYPRSPAELPDLTLPPLDGQEGLLADLQSVMGPLLTHIGAYELAVEFQEGAYYTALAVHGPAAETTLENLVPLAEAALSSGLIERYEGDLERAVNASSDVAGSAARRRLQLVWAHLLLVRHEYDRAEAVLQELLAIQESLSDPGYDDLLRTREAIAKLRLYQGRGGEARAILEHAFEARQQELSDITPAAAVNRRYLGGIEWVAGNYEAAEMLMRKALDIDRRALGDQHPLTSSSLQSLGVCLRDQGKFAEAEPLIRKAWQIRAQSCNGMCPARALSSNTLATLLYFMGRYGEAEHLAKEAADWYSSNADADGLGLAEAELLVGLCRLEQGSAAEGRPFIRRSLDARRDAREPERWKTALATAADVHASPTIDAEQRTTLRESLLIMEEDRGPDNPWTLHVREWLAASDP